MFPAREYAAPHELLRPYEELSRFLELGLADPLVFSAIELRKFYSNLGALAYRAQTVDGHNPHGMTVTLALHEISEAIVSAVNELIQEYIEAPKLPVALLLNKFEAFAEMLEAAKRGYLEICSKISLAPERYEPMLRQAGEEFDSMKERQKLITPVHLALQSHLEHLVTFGMPSHEDVTVESAQFLYSPLFALRDEYFTTPRPELLQEYLATVAVTENTPEFAELVSHRREVRARNSAVTELAKLEASDARIPQLALELEVLGMLETATLD